MRQWWPKVEETPQGGNPKKPLHQGVGLPLLVAGWAALACLATQAAQDGYNDFSYFWVAAHALVSGQNPYHAVEAMGSYPLYYPGPAVLVLAPFGLLPIRVGWVAFAFVSGYAYGLAIQRYGRGLLPGAVSACFVEAIGYGQWPPLLVAGTVLPVLGGLLICKPSVGLALFAGWPHRWAVLGGMFLFVAACWFLPTWPTDWLNALRETNHVIPILRPWGWLLLLSALRWRTPEGRFLLALSLVPQTTALHGALPLFLVCRSKWEGYALAGLSFVAVAGYTLVPGTGTLEGDLAARWPLVLGLVYLPALGLVLRRRRSIS